MQWEIVTSIVPSSSKHSVANLQVSPQTAEQCHLCLKSMWKLQSVNAPILRRFPCYHWTAQLANNHKLISRYKFPNKTLGSAYIFTEHNFSLLHPVMKGKSGEIK